MKTAQEILGTDILSYILTSNNDNYKETVLSKLEAKAHFSDIGQQLIYEMIQENPSISEREINVNSMNYSATQREVIQETLSDITSSSHISELELFKQTEKFIKRELTLGLLMDASDELGAHKDFDMSIRAKEITDFTLVDNPNEVLSLTDIMNIELEEYKWHCETFLPVIEGKLTMVSGRGASGKGITMIRNALIYLVENPTKKVLLWNMEDSTQDMHLRIKTLRENGIVVSDDVMSRLKVLNSTTNITYSQLQVKFKDYDYVVVDPMSHLLQGDENDSAVVKPIMIYFSNICKDENKIIILVHHEAKGATGKGSGQGRGSSAFFDNVRLSYSLSYEDGLYNVKTVKNNYGENREEFTLDPWNLETKQAIGAELSNALSNNSNASMDVLEDLLNKAAS